MSAPAMRRTRIAGVQITPWAPRDSLDKPSSSASRHAGRKLNSTQRRGWGCADLP